MSLVLDKIRRWVKGSGTTGIIPTIPVSNDHTDGSWLATDIYDREMFVNTEDLAVFIRCKNTILRVNNNIASAINTDTTNFTKNLSAADTTVQKALQTFNDAILGHTIQDNGVVQTSRSNLNFIGFTITDDSINDAIKIEVGSEALSPTTITTTTVLDGTYNFVLCNSASPITVTLPSATILSKISVKNINTGLVTVQRTGTELIDDQTSYDLEQWDCMDLLSDNINWFNS